MSQPSHRPPVRVLHLVPGSDAGGISRYVYDLCTAMHARGHQVAVAGEPGAWRDLFASAPFPWVHAPLKGGPLALRRAARNITAHLRRHPADILHCHARRPVLAARRVQRQFNVSVLYTLHLTDISFHPFARLLSDFGDHAHAPSQQAQRWLIETAGVPAGRVTLIPHGIDPLRFPMATDTEQRQARERLCLPADATVASYVGRFDTPKNEDWMLDLAARTRESLPTLRIVMLGEGPHEAALRNRLARERLNERVTILPYGDPLPVYRACDVLMLPSDREGFALVCAEAMSVGRTVLRTRTAGAEEMIVESETGRSVPTGDAVAFLAAAETMLPDRATLRRMGQAAAAHVRSRLVFDEQVQRTLALYERLAAGTFTPGR